MRNIEFIDIFRALVFLRVQLNFDWELCRGGRDPFSRTAAGYILAAEGVSRSQISAQVWRALRYRVLYMRYKKEPYSTTIWEVIRFSLRVAILL